MTSGHYALLSVHEQRAWNSRPPCQHYSQQYGWSWQLWWKFNNEQRSIKVGWESLRTYITDTIENSRHYDIIEGWLSVWACFGLAITVSKQLYPENSGKTNKGPVYNFSMQIAPYCTSLKIHVYLPVWNGLRLFYVIIGEFKIYWLVHFADKGCCTATTIALTRG